MTTTLALAATDTLRSANMEDLVALLRTQADLKYDVVVSASAIRYEHGLLVVEGGALGEFTVDDIVEGTDAATNDRRLRPTSVCEDQVADKLGIPPRYIRKMREDAWGTYQHLELWQGDEEKRAVDASALLDHNVNHWLQRHADRRFLIRAFADDDPANIGVARAFLSDRFGAIDNLDVLVAAMKGIRDANVGVTVDRCELTERNMRVRFLAPDVQALAPLWLKGYRSPFEEDGAGGSLNRATSVHRLLDPTDKPVVFAGLQLSNSETGGGAFQLAPQVVVQWCTNGATMRADAMREIHLGGKLDDGLVIWSDDTQQRSLDLIVAKARDAVATFLDKDYLTKVVERIEEQAGAPVKEPTKVVERVGKRFGFSQAEQESILSAFITSGQSTAGGVMNALTAAAQTFDDADRAAEFEDMAVDVMAFVAAS